MIISNTITFNVWILKAAKQTAFVVSAIMVTFGLFVLMSELIANNNSFQPEPEAPFQVSISSVREDSNTKIIKKMLPTPPAIKPMPKPVVAPELADDNVSLVANTGWQFKMDSIDANTFVSAGPKNVTAVPMVRVPPNYPRKAASEGLEGWVSMSFSIDELGKVIDVVVVDSEPKRLFDREAKKALKKWKYKPKIVDGKPVVQTNQSVMLEFKLSEQ
ncbi:MAG: energy transducer TonB [Gammaproteobacteria bacterium]|nr:energy transducer TonB [Gammaproteobacteria bacterium]